MRPSESRFIYFLRPIGWDGPVKIGCSNYPMLRLNALMAWSPSHSTLTAAPERAA